MSKLKDSALIYRADTLARMLSCVAFESRVDEEVRFHYLKILERLQEILPNRYTVDIRDPDSLADS